MEKNNDSSPKHRDAGRLQQMSEEMKLHIAQLKAELGSAEATQQNTGLQRKLDERARNKAVATVLRQRMELEKQKELAAEQSETSIASSDNVYGILLKKDSREPLSDVASEDYVHATEYTFSDAHRRRHKSDGVGDVIEPHTRTRALSGERNIPRRDSSPVEIELKFLSDARDSPDKARKNMTGSRPDASCEEQIGAAVDPSHSQEKSLDLETDEKAFYAHPEVSSKKNMKTSFPAENPPSLSLSQSKASLKLSRRNWKERTKSRHKDSASSTETSISTPRSFAEPTEDSIPVKYLQMTNTSPKLIKKARSTSRIKNKSSSVPSSARGSKSDTALVRTKALDEEEEEKYALLEAQLFKLQLQCEQLAEENIKMKREERSKAIEKISTLKKSNGELANIARRLEEKARSLQEQNAKKSQELTSVTRELQQQKRAHQRSKARWESEQSRTLTERNDEIVTAKNQVEDLKRALRQVRREKMVQTADMDSGDELTVFKQNQKEMLHLQKLAAAASSKVVVRSLSTPVTARQKILEESNRSLRRQLAAAEANLQEADCKELSTDHLRNTLTFAQEENEALKKEIENHKASIATLQSVLQESKVETSDVSVQLTDLKHVHIQLQDDYATVHEQLSVAIQERDTAAKKCMQHNDRINEMETLIKKLEEKERTDNFPQREEEMTNMINSHEKIVAEYQDALSTLQSKVTQLERQCHDQTTANKTMKDQLSRLVQWSKNNPTQDGGQRADNHIKPADNSNNNNIEGLSRVFSDQSPASSPRSLTRKSLPGRKSGTVNDQTTALLGRRVRQLPHKSHEEEDMDSDDTEAEDFDDEMEPHDGAVVPVNDASPSASSVLKLYIAKYTYKPDQGPNAHPEFELPLVAGDYLYICGDMDEDGFFEGELMDGRRGLVPSNFIEPLHEPPSIDNSPQTREASNSFPSDNNYQQHDVTDHPNGLRRSADHDLSHSICSSASGGSRDSRHLLPPSADSRPTGVLPYPRKLQVDKKLSHTLIIGWLPPGLQDDEIVEEYHILVDGRLVTVVDGNKCKAVVENIHHDKKSYLISVCCVTKYGRSDPGHCVITHGGTRHNATTQVSDVDIEYVSTDSARVSWKPTNSNFPNNISIGAVDEETSDKLRHYQRQILAPPPMYRHTINGLKPNTVYELVVKRREGRQSVEAVSPPVRFITTLVGPPDPPLGVEVEENPSNESIVVSWIPISLNDRGISNGEVVRGYSIYINNVLFSSVEPSSCDECIVSMKGLASSVRKIIEEDVSCRDPSFGFTHGLPSIRITLRTLTESGNLSDFSTPFQLHKSLVTRMLQNTSDRVGAGDEKVDHLDEEKSLLKSQLDESDRSDGGSNSTGLNLNEPSVSVPSIEITLDTSSEDEAHSFSFAQNRSRPFPAPRHSTSPSNKQGGSPIPKRAMNDAVAKLKLQEHKGVKSRSWGYSDHHPTLDPTDRREMNSSIPKIGLHRRTQSDEESGTSVSSGGHTSTSTSGSVGRKRRSPSQKQLKMHQSWTDTSDMGVRGGYSPSMVKSSTPKSRSANHHHAYSESHSPDGRRNAAARQRKGSHTMSSQNERGSVSEFDSVDDSRVSLFVALYDYNPQTMSPNVDDCDDELSFKEGQLLKVYGEKGSDGFYIGENTSGRRGYVPSNMVSYVEVDDYTMLEDLLEQGHLPPESPLLHPTSSPLLKESEGEAFQDSHAPVLENDTTNPSVYRALYNYDPKEASPNIDAEVELSFARGDLVNIFGGVDEDGFFRGEIRGQFGLVPSNFVEPIADDQFSVAGNQVRKVSATTMTEASSVAKKVNKTIDPVSFTSTSSNSSSNKGEGAKKKGIFSKGKKLLKKLGNNETRRR